MSEKEIPQFWTPTENCICWEKLEKMRMKRLGIPKRFTGSIIIKHHENCEATLRYPLNPFYDPSQEIGNQPKLEVNNSPNVAKPDSLCPFFTQGKPTCGFFFSRQTENRRNNFGIPPNDLVRWRRPGMAKHQ